jgi:polyhydroxybutyrate depolymerase
MLAVACRTPSAPTEQKAPTGEREARELVQAARRDVERDNDGASSTPDQLYVPTSVGAGRRPLLVFLHGLGSSGSELAGSLGLREFAEAHGFAFMAPDGYRDYSGRRFWNASSSCCNFDRLQVDHVAALRQWISAAVRHPGVDPARVYVVGYSNGGFMAYRAACELGSLLHGIVSIAGAGPSDTKLCKPDTRLSVLEIHGDRDAIVAFGGGHLFADTRRPRHPSADSSVSFWAKFDGCSEPRALTRSLDLDPRIPGGETQVQAYPNCGSRRVELWTIQGGDHASGFSRRSLDAIWQFIAEDATDIPAAPG